MNRKLVRPNLAELKERLGNGRTAGVLTPAPQGPPPQERTEPPHGQHAPQPGGPRRRSAPPDATSAEAFYYLKQMNARTPMVVVLDDGQQLRGHIEWYDRNCIKVNRDDAPNLLVFKHAIRYLYKQEEESKKV
jgi:sRNA-binding regulator protein Hfq